MGSCVFGRYMGDMMEKWEQSVLTIIGIGVVAYFYTVVSSMHKLVETTLIELRDLKRKLLDKD
jgi:hypothetical protein